MPPQPGANGPAARADKADGRPLVSDDDLLRFEPNWCLFWSRRVRSYQLDIWIPYMKRSRYRFAIMSAADDIRPVDREKIAQLPNVIVVEPFELGLRSLRACPGFLGYLYVGSRPENFLAVNRNGAKAHVFIGHGESGKVTSGLRTASLYDSVFVAEYSVVRRFPGAIRLWIWKGACAIGTTIVEGVRRDAWIEPRPIRTILYAPTWEQDHPRGDLTSLDAVGPLLVLLLPELTVRGIEVILRAHPGTGGRRPELKPILEELAAAGAVTGVGKTEAFDRADVLISDVSGVTAEFLLTGKPSILPVTTKLAQRNRDAAWLAVEYPWVYRWDVDSEGLGALLTTIETKDPLRARRAATAKRKFRHHRSIDDAVRTFDIALATLRWRKWPIPLRIPFELNLVAARLRPSRSKPAR